MDTAGGRSISWDGLKRGNHPPPPTPQLIKALYNIHKLDYPKIACMSYYTLYPFIKPFSSFPQIPLLRNPGASVQKKYDKPHSFAECGRAKEPLLELPLDAAGSCSMIPYSCCSPRNQTTPSPACIIILRHHVQCITHLPPIPSTTADTALIYGIPNNSNKKRKKPEGTPGHIPPSHQGSRRLLRKPYAQSRRPGRSCRG